MANWPTRTGRSFRIGPEDGLKNYSRFSRDKLSAMKTLYLIARRLDDSPSGNKYMLAVGPNPDLGMSPTPTSDHCYPTLDDLCEVIDDCEAMEPIDVAALRVAMENGKPCPEIRITKESASCMGFKV